MILVHGFGGNADHFRKNTPVLGQTGPTYAIDLLGYGYADKPDPGPWEEKNKIYNFENWGDQLVDFAREVVGKPVFIVCNSVGGCAGLQAAKVGGPSAVKGVVLFNVSLRMLHTTKQPALLRPFVSGLQYVLRETSAGAAFFANVAKAKAVKNVLQQCYGDPAAVTDELVDCILRPGLEPGAVKVFLDFISYSGGPLPEELLPEMQVPVLIGWGEKDPWEPIAQGREYAKFKCVEDFVTLPGVGHCPQDEAPQLVNEIVRKFVLKHQSA
ncbi:Alpha/Beta hydrolase protein [Tribonema minus]|uniref:Alpha/Beta hydrolase protein n=1 Tax=Tribonema minus TaxID=303371 RepID=A0A835YVL0_9STRA|nr:Alpha/Beta hydrolase protein [Tribonema minus]